MASMLYLLLMVRAVQNTFGNSTAFVFGPVTVNAIIPVIYVILGAKDQRPFWAAGIDQFQKIIGFRFRKRPEKSFVNDKQVKPGIGLFNLILRIQAFPELFCAAGKAAASVVIRPLGGWWICFPVFLYRGFQQGLDPTDGRVAAEQKDLPACLFDPLGFVSSRIFFQADTRLKTLLRSLPGFQKESDDFFCIGADRRSPGLEIILRVGKILPMVLRHMGGYHDRVPLTAGLSWMDSHPVPVEEYFHRIARHTDADRFSNQVIWDRILV